MTTSSPSSTTECVQAPREGWWWQTARLGAEGKGSAVFRCAARAVTPPAVPPPRSVHRHAPATTRRRRRGQACRRPRPLRRPRQGAHEACSPSPRSPRAAPRAQQRRAHARRMRTQRPPASDNETPAATRGEQLCGRPRARGSLPAARTARQLMKAAVWLWPRQQKMQNPTGAACAAAPRFLKTPARAGSLRAASGRFLKTLAQKFSS